MLTETKAAAALGLFDGVHLGHKSVLEKAVGYKYRGFVPACFTFNNDSLENKQLRKIQYIYSHEQKCRYIRECGIEDIYSFDFEAIRTLTPSEFVKMILVDKMNCAAVVCGEDFKFGFNASADVCELMRLCRTYDIECRVVSQIELDGLRISSAAVRSALSLGDIAKARSLLGRDFSIVGTVFCDHRKGTKMGVPTLNLKTSAPLRLGVYASNVAIDGRIYKSITNVGKRPTFYDNSDIVVETHILDFDKNLYDCEVEVVFDGFIRDEKRFDSAHELIEQIERDIETLRLF